MKSKEPITAEAALIRMADLCARSEQSAGAIRRKLFRLGLTSHDIEKIVAELYDRRFIDDRRFAGAFVRDGVRISHHGRHKLAMKLRALSIPSQVIAEALEQIDDAEYEAVLERVTLSKAARLDLNDRKDTAKLYRSLIARGFESPLVVNAIKKIRKAANEE